MNNEQEHTDRTLEYYNNNASAFTADTQNVDFSVFQKNFLQYIPEGGRILDLGCGAGRDSKAFIDAGYKVDAVDGSAELCRIAESYIGQPVTCARFQDFEPEGMYNGIWACASFLHLNIAEISNFLIRIAPHLSPSGCIYLSFKYGDFSGYKKGRFFQYLTEDTLSALLQNIPQLHVREIQISGDVRPGRADEKWLNLILSSKSAVDDCIDSIKETCNHQIIKLFDAIDNLFYSDPTFKKLYDSSPLWVADAGLSAESTLSNIQYENLTRTPAYKKLGKIVYYYDLLNILTAIQDRLLHIIHNLNELYKIITYSPIKAGITKLEIIRKENCLSRQSHLYLDNIFVAISSILDLTTKLAVEQAAFNNYDFTHYKTMKSRGILYNAGSSVIDETLKNDDFIFTRAYEINVITNFRNEYIHNGAWDRQLCMYENFSNSKLIDRYILMPDISPAGNFEKCCTRYKFYSKKNRANEIVVDITRAVIERVSKTISQIYLLYKSMQQKATS